MTDNLSSGPSEAAVEAAAARHTRSWDHLLPDELTAATESAKRHPVAAILAAAHDPSLGLDRSVRLGDVTAWMSLRSACQSVGVPGGEAAQNALAQAAAAMAREFGGVTDAE